jgi:hypothetical protein
MAFLCPRIRRTARSGGPVTYSLFFVNKPPDGSHQMEHGNVNAAFPENLGDPMHTEPATVRLQDLFLILSQCVDLGLLAITVAFRASRDNVLRPRPRPRIRPVLRQVELHPRTGLAT